ncbi:MAG: sodium/solute symporter [Acidobacteriota bacterium]
MQLHFLDFFVVGAYLGGMIFIGVWFSRRQTSRESYFLGNRNVHWSLAGISSIATLLSTITYLSTPGEVIKFGIGYYSSLFALVLVVPLINYLVIPTLMRLPVTSVYEYLERRFGSETRTTAASVFVLTRLLWMGMIIYTASLAVTEMTGWNLVAVICIMGLLTTLYTTMGGLEAVVWSDFVQFLVLAGGAVVIPLYVAYQTGAGPLAWWNVFSQAGRTEVPVFSWDLTLRVTMLGIILDNLVWNLCTHGADQVAAQRYLSTASLAAARRAVQVFAICNVGLIALLALCGMALFYFDFGRSGLSLAEFSTSIAATADNVMPRFIATQLPNGVSGLLLAALLAAAMSSVGSGINSISTVVVTDFLPRLAEKNKTHGGLVLAMSIAALSGVAAVVFAYLVSALMQRQDWNLVDLLERVLQLCVAPLGALFLSGILFWRVSQKAALLGFTLGMLTSIGISFSREIFNLERGISFMWIMPVSFLVSLMSSCVLSYLFTPPSREQLVQVGGTYKGQGPLNC